MGRRGPARRPTALSLVAGEVKKDRLNFDEPQPAAGVPQCPEGVADAVREVWEYTLEQVDTMRILSMADRDALYAYCEAVVMHRDASKILSEEGMIIEGSHGGLVKHPAQAIQKEAAGIMRAFGREFGLTPSARTEIKVSPAQNDKQGAARLLS